jgi:hypothetical protein
LACEFPRLAEVKCHHGAGVEFKLHPHRTTSSRPALQKWHQEISQLALELWLWLETRRLDGTFASAQDYALSPRPKCPETKWWRNYLVNLKAFGPRRLLPRDAARYPRERILEALSLLLWEPKTCADPPLLRHVQSALHTSASTFPELVQAYRALWHRFN